MTPTQLQQTINEHFKVPKVLQSVANTANSDLYHGPIYTNGRGEWLAWCDPDARQFDFSRACAMLSDWLDQHISDCYLEDWSGCIVDTIPEESLEYDIYYELQRAEIARALFGRELAGYVQ